MSQNRGQTSQNHTNMKKTTICEDVSWLYVHEVNNDLTPVAGTYRKIESAENVQVTENMTTTNEERIINQTINFNASLTEITWPLVGHLILKLRIYGNTYIYIGSKSPYNPVQASWNNENGIAVVSCTRQTTVYDITHV